LGGVVVSTAGREKSRATERGEAILHGAFGRSGLEKRYLRGRGANDADPPRGQKEEWTTRYGCVLRDLTIKFLRVIFGDARVATTGDHRGSLGREKGFHTAGPARTGPQLLPE